MKILQTVSLLVIAIVLACELSISQILPAYYYQAEREAFLALAIECEKAKAATIEFNATNESMDIIFINKVETALRVHLVSCHNHEKLRQYLVSRGISFAALNFIDLQAKEHEDVSLPSLVDRYAH